MGGQHFESNVCFMHKKRINGVKLLLQCGKLLYGRCMTDLLVVFYEYLL